MKDLKPYLIAFTIVVTFCLSVRFVLAGEPLPQQVQESFESIQSNQKRIADLRKYVDEFELLKNDNAKLVGRMEAFGYTYDWSVNSPVKMSNQDSLK